MDYLRAFFRAALGDGQPPVIGEDAVNVLRIIELANPSSAAGRRVSL